MFRLVVFRPFVGEVLVGWVSSCTEEGLNVKMEFFDDIHIPKHLLFESCVLYVIWGLFFLFFFLNSANILTILAFRENKPGYGKTVRTIFT